MGGHGGLNILHQKKWNVYNLDNRMKVQRDRRQARQQQRQQQIERRNRQTKQRLEVIEGEKEVEKRSEKQPDHNSSLLTEELRRINQSNKHINLFENEQRIIENREITEAKIQREKEYLRDKDFDVASKFMGAYNDQKMKPWYLKTSDKSTKGKQDLMSNLHHIEKTASQVTKEVLKTELLDKESMSKRKRSRSRSRSRDRQVKPQLSKMEQMKLQRRQREEKQRKRAEQLLRRHH